MNEESSETILTVLLKLNAGLLDPERASEIRLKISSDSRWSKRWRRLRENWFDSQQSLSDLRQMNIDPQLIAGFVDQMLPLQKARRLENAAWRSPSLLREIAVAFQSAHLPVTESSPVEIDYARIERSLMGSLVSEHLTSDHNGKNSRLNDSWEKLLNPRATVVGELAKRDRHNRGAARGHRPSQLRRLVLVLAASFVLLAALVGWLYNSSWSPRIAKPDVGNSLQQEEPTRDFKSSPRPQKENPQKRQRTPSNRFSLDTGDEDELGAHWPPLEDLAADDSLFTGEMDEDPPAKAVSPQRIVDQQLVPKPQVLLNPQRIYLPMRPDWDRYEGIVGLWDPEDGIIRGYGNTSELSDQMEIRVFPESWAAGDIPSVGKIVVDADSTLRVGRQFSTDVDQSDATDLQVELKYGRFAVKDLQPDTRLFVRTGNARWPITVARPATAVAIEYAADAARLYVRRGEIEIRGEKLSANQQIRWHRGKFDQAEKATEIPRWIDRPDSYARIPALFRKQLFESSNIEDELVRLKSSGDKTMRLAASQWALTVDPGLAARILASGDTSQWPGAFTWLVRQPHGHQRTRVAWRSLVQTSGNPDAVREFVRWSNLMMRNELPSASEIQQMVARLMNDQMLVRYGASYFLEYYFENPFGYRADAAAAVRAHIAHNWRAHIIEIYRTRSDRTRRN